MTEEDRTKAEEQLAALSEAYSELCQQCSDETNSADEVGPFVDPLMFNCMTNHEPPG